MMERAVRHLQKHRNSGRLKGCVEKELEEEEKKKTAWEKEVSDLAEHQIAAEAASTKACEKLRKLSKDRASADDPDDLGAPVVSDACYDQSHIHIGIDC